MDRLASYQLGFLAAGAHPAAPILLLQPNGAPAPTPPLPYAWMRALTPATSWIPCVCDLDARERFGARAGAGLFFAFEDVPVEPACWRGLPEAIAGLTGAPALPSDRPPGDPDLAALAGFLASDLTAALGPDLAARARPETGWPDHQNGVRLELIEADLVPRAPTGRRKPGVWL